MAAPASAQKSEEDWRAILFPEQFHILRQKGTGMGSSGEVLDCDEPEKKPSLKGFCDGRLGKGASKLST
ncbi:hypothetical protein QN277_009602 [Acacia crassicarpa]|uniref:Uncharacterized protein n=1 Tax=Acacia crassicarpa TaxID=499986 RepID=A0AAE1IRD3_9FABA|nr:hypothetical protein QN277_009602 [Acacia crassicarpa]